MRSSRDRSSSFSYRYNPFLQERTVSRRSSVFNIDMDQSLSIGSPLSAFDFDPFREFTNGLIDHVDSTEALESSIDQRETSIDLDPRFWDLNPSGRSSDSSTLGFVDKPISDTTLITSPRHPSRRGSTNVNPQAFQFASSTTSIYSPDPQHQTLDVASQTGDKNSDNDTGPKIDSLEVPRSSSQTRKLAIGKSYNCSECDYTISNRKHYGDHMRDRHGLLAFKCAHCDTRVARYDNLESHKKHCKKRPADENTPASVTIQPIKVKQGKRQRVCIRPRSSALHPPKKVTPPSGSGESRTAISAIIRMDSPDPQQEPAASQISTLSHTPVNDLVSRTTADLLREIEELKLSLKQMTDECEVWRKQYHQSKQEFRTLQK